jgi:hypothetical protein
MSAAMAVFSAAAMFLALYPKPFDGWEHCPPPTQTTLFEKRHFLLAVRRLA